MDGDYILPEYKKAVDTFVWFEREMKQQHPENGTIGKETLEFRVYRIRWFILALFVMYSAVNSMQWIQFSIIADVITEFYGVDYNTVNWTSQIYMVLYIPFIFPASYLLDKLVSYSYLRMKVSYVLEKCIHYFCHFCNYFVSDCSELFYYKLLVLNRNK